MNEKDWNRFEQTGNIKHYLRYRGIDGYVPANREVRGHPHRDG